MPTSSRLITAIATLLIALGALVALDVSPARAAGSCNDTWTGAGGDDWNTNSSWSTGAVPSSSSDVCIPAGSFTVITTGTASADSISVGAGDTLDLFGTSFGTDGYLTLTDADNGSGVASGATVVMGFAGTQSDKAFETGGGFRVSTGTLVNQGSITAAATNNVQSPDELLGSFDNSGTLAVPGTLVSTSPGTWTNTGTISVGSGGDLQLGSSSTAFSFSEPSGSLSNAGTVTDGGTAFAVTGTGSVSGTAPVLNTADTQLSSSGGGSVDQTSDTGTLTGTIAAGWTLQIAGNASVNNGLLSTNGPVTNNGTILLGQLSSVTHGTIHATNGTLTNNGTITSEQVDSFSSGASEIDNEIDGALVNNGTLQINNSLDGTPSAWTLGGTVTIPAGQQLALSGPGSGSASVTLTGTVTDSGDFSLGNAINVIAQAGTMSGNPVVVGNGVLTVSGSGSGEFHVESGGGQLGSDIAAGYTVWASGIPGDANGDLTPTGSFINHGTLLLGSSDGTLGALTVPAGDTFTNAATMTLQPTGNGNIDALNGALVNAGTLTADTSFSGTGQITNNAAVELTAAAAKSSAASFTQGAGATLTLDATGGATPVVPQLDLTGGAQVAGTLSVTTTGGTATGSFPVIAAKSGAGTFSTAFTGESYGVTYASGSVTLTSAGSGPGSSSGSGSGSGSGSSSGTGPAVGAPPPSVNRVSGGAGRITIKLTCAAQTACASYAVTGTVKVVEKVKGRRKTLTETILRKTGTLAAGRTVTLSIPVNGEGKRLLKQGALTASVTVTVGTSKLKTLKVKISKPVVKKKRTKK